MTKHNPEAPLRVESNLSDRLLELLPMLKSKFMPTLIYIEWKLMDSSDLNSLYWKVLAKQIFAEYYNYDGFVILMGTDTIT